MYDVATQLTGGTPELATTLAARLAGGTTNLTFCRFADELKEAHAYGPYSWAYMSCGDERPILLQPCRTWHMQHNTNADFPVGGVCLGYLSDPFGKVSMAPGNVGDNLLAGMIGVCMARSELTKYLYNPTFLLQSARLTGHDSEVLEGEVVLRVSALEVRMPLARLAHEYLSRRRVPFDRSSRGGDAGYTPSQWAFGVVGALVQPMYGRYKKVVTSVYHEAALHLKQDLIDREYRKVPGIGLVDQATYTRLRAKQQSYCDQDWSALAVPSPEDMKAIEAAGTEAGRDEGLNRLLSADGTLYASMPRGNMTQVVDNARLRMIAVQRRHTL